MLVRSILSWLILLFLLPIGNTWAGTTILPPAKTCFTDANGAVVSGSINLFYPTTTTVKPSWQDSSQTILNTNPIILDSNGCALIFGVGAYREQLFDANGSLLFDAVTTDTSAENSIYWAGLSGGTPNVITLVDPGFNGTDGTVINFTALASNTGSTTINPSGFGPISVVKSTTVGPVSLTGGEIIQNNQISVVYSASANTFTILNPPIITAAGGTAPRCGISNLKIINDGSTPNSIVDITAAQTVLVSSAGINITRNSVNTTMNISIGTVTSTVNGMDGEAPGVSGWLYIFLIDNGSTTGAVGTLASGNGLAPNLPSGYSFECYAGAIRVDGSGNLLRTIQLGRDAQYIVGTNPATTLIIANGIAGTYSATSPVLASVSVATFVPPIATSIVILAERAWKGSTGADVLIAPNTSWGGTNNGPQGSAGNVWPVWFLANSTSATATFILESTTIAWASDNTGAAIAVLGWKDGYVNAP
jgi:hypothetical protein